MKGDIKFGFFIASKTIGGYESRYLKFFKYLIDNKFDVKIFLNYNLKDSKNKLLNDLNCDNKYNSQIIFIGNPFFKFQGLFSFFFRKMTNNDFFVHFLIRNLYTNPVDYLVTNKDFKSLGLIKKKIPNLRIIKEFTSPDKIDQCFNSKDIQFNENVDHISFVSESVYNRFVNYSGGKLLDHRKYSVAQIPFYYESENFEVKEVNEKTNSMIFAHRWIERKNPVLFAQLVNILLNDDFFNDWDFYFFGKGKEEKKIKDILKSHLNNDRLKIEYTYNLKKYLKKSKFFFSFIEPDNFPSQSISEAMYYCNVLVLLDTGFSSFYINKNGILVNKDIYFIKNRLKEIISENLYEMCVNSRIHLNNKFSIEKYEEYYMGIIKKISRDL